MLFVFFFFFFKAGRGSGVEKGGTGQEGENWAGKNRGKRGRKQKAFLCIECLFLKKYVHGIINKNITFAVLQSKKGFFCQSIKKNIRKSYVRKQRKQRSKMSFIALQYVILFFIKTLSLFPNPHHKLSSLCHYGNM